MKFSKVTRVVVVSLLIFGQGAQAGADVIDVSKIASGGNGCLGGGDLEVYQSEFSGRVMVYFPAMKVDVTQKALDRKACALSLPITLPAGKRLVIGEPAVFGSTDISEGASVLAAAEVFEAGDQGPKVERELQYLEDDHGFFYERDSTLITTACGAVTTVRANVSLLGKKGSSPQGAVAILEGMAMTLEIEDCEQKP